MKCRNCQRVESNRPRGLCWSCYYKPGVRALFPSTSKFARRGVGNGRVDVPMPVEPTAAAPGSCDKLAVLEERASQGVSLWHPADAPMDAESFVLGIR